MSETSVQLDVYVNRLFVGVLTRGAAGSFVFTYLPDTPSESFVSLTMPVRPQSYVWARGVHPFFQQNLPEGFQKDLIRQRLGPLADVSDAGLLGLTGRRAIGRVEVVPHGSSLGAGSDDVGLASLLSSPDSRDALLRKMAEGAAEGVSGVMPKSLQYQQKATASTERYLLKTGLASLPGLAINEYLCLMVASQAGLYVPEALLSDDGNVLAVRRFDEAPDGSRIAVEDFCALKGLDPASKYKGSLEEVCRLLGVYVPGLGFGDTARKFFKHLLLNVTLRNADAHLKNFALTYTSKADVQLSPVFDIVTVNAYPEHEADAPALTLAGRKVWPCGQQLQLLGANRLSLSATDMAACYEDIATAVATVTPAVADHADRFPAFRETAKRMLNCWTQGLLDARPDTRTPAKPKASLRASAGLSDDQAARKPTNRYQDPDGGFSHKAR